MTRKTYNRPYQNARELRLFGCYRSKEHTVFTGQGFADNAEAWLEYGGVLTQLENNGGVTHQSTKTGDYDILVTQRFDADFPFRVYVTNPDDEDGKASNALEFEKPADIPVLDVRVDGKSVVKDQVADIDLTGKLDVIMRPNKVYGTDGDGREVQFDRQQIEGVQHVFVNGDEQPLDSGNIRLTDIAKESKTVQRVNVPLQIYGTNEAGEEATYPRDFFATSENVAKLSDDLQATKSDLANVKTDLDKAKDDISKSMSDISLLQSGKQDKDTTATDGTVAVIKSGQSVGSDVDLKTLNDTVTTDKNRVDNLETQVSNGIEKDWKSSEDGKKILNNPINEENSNIIITPLPVSEENDSYRSSDSAYVYGKSTHAAGDGSDASTAYKIGDGTVLIGEGDVDKNFVTAIGIGVKADAPNAVAVGSNASATVDDSVALGNNAASESGRSVSIGSGSNVTATAADSVAIGSGSIASKPNVFAIGSDPGDGETYQQSLRVLRAVDTPVMDHDAANKQYVDTKASSGGAKIALDAVVDDSGIEDPKAWFAQWQDGTYQLGMKIPGVNPILDRYTINVVGDFLMNIDIVSFGVLRSMTVNFRYRIRETPQSVSQVVSTINLGMNNFQLPPKHVIPKDFFYESPYYPYVFVHGCAFSGANNVNDIIWKFKMFESNNMNLAVANLETMSSFPTSATMLSGRFHTVYAVKSTEGDRLTNRS